MKNTANETVTIKGIEYEVLQSETPEQHEANDRPNTARTMRENGHARSLTLKRPNGRALYYTVESTNGRCKKPMSLGTKLSK